MIKRMHERLYRWGRRSLPDPVKRTIKTVKNVLRWYLPFDNKTPRIIDSEKVDDDSFAYDVLTLPIVDFDFLYQRPQQLCRQFALNGHRVFYLKTAFGRPILSRRSYKARYIESRIIEVMLPCHGGLVVYRDCIDESTCQLFSECMADLCKDYGISKAICLVQLPFWWPLASKLRERFGWKIVYDCMDEHAGFSQYGAAMLAYEDRLSRGSDLVLATSQRLLEKQRRHNPNTLLVTNAADYEHFRQQPDRASRFFGSVQRPIIGYYGAISEWFDSDLMSQMARLCPDWSFVLIGRVFNANLSWTKGLANVHVLDEQPYASLAGYLHSFDVCAVPFKMTPLTEAASPIKFYEYLSAGKPVVSVPLPELKPFESRGLVYLAESPQEFVSRIQQALCEDDVNRKTIRQEFAKANTWESRFEEIRRAISGLEFE